MPGRTFTTSVGETYRYGFNGKENIDEVHSSTGTFQDYGFRMYDTRVCRFISVDPITSSYPMLTPYQFASNTPIQAIDIDGLEAFIVHGTRQGKTGVQFTPSAIEQFKRLGGNSATDDKFRWNAPISNDVTMRKTAAKELVQYIVEARAAMMAAGTITADEPITLVGYSHGVNVSIQAAQMLNDEYGVKVNLITVGTPAKNSAFNVDSDNWLFGNPEDPQGNTGINAQYHIRHINDKVWEAADALESDSEPYYSNEGTTTNYTIPNTGIKLDGPIESHTKLPSHSKFGEALNQLPKMKSAPAAGELKKR